MKANCTASIERRIRRWEHEEVIEARQAALTAGPMPCAFGEERSNTSSARSWTAGRSHLKARRLGNVATEASLHILAYNIKRAIALCCVPGESRPCRAE